MPRRTLIVGGSGTLGRSIARIAGERGDRIAITGRTPERVEAATALLAAEGIQAQAAAVDVRDARAVEAAILNLVERLDGLDHLVFAAGRLRAFGPAVDADPAEWEADLTTSLVGFMNVARPSVPALGRSDTASITLLVGHGHHAGIANASAYSAAQAGLVRLVEGLASELKPAGIPVYAVYPGIVPSRFTEHLIDTPEGRRHLPWVNEAFAEGKEVSPEFTAEMVEWLTRARPSELSGRAVFAPLSPDLLELRLSRIEAEDLNRLRLR